MRIKGSHNGYVDKKCTVNMAENRAYQKASAAVYEKTTKPKFLTSKLPDATIGREWSAQLEANGTKPIIWKCDENGIPEGFTLSDTGLLNGIPLELKKYKFKITVENSAGKKTKTFSLNVKQEKPSITTYTIPYGVVKAPYSITLEADGTEPIKWSKSGKFPSGLKLVAKTGEITGKPKKAGTYNFTVKAKNKSGTDTVSMQMVVYTEEPKGEDATVASAFSPVISEETEHVNAELYLISGDEEIDGEITVEPGKPLEFGILGWIDEYGYEVENPDTEIFIDGIPAEGIEISDEGTFILPAEYVNGTFSVCARAISESDDEGLYSGTVTVKAEALVEDSEDSENAPETSENSSNGCNAGFAGIILLSLCSIITSRKK